MQGWDARTDQQRVTDWMRSTFTGAECEDVPERSLRMAEEALELTQACGVDAATLHQLVDYVFSRPVGKPQQEIAGCLVTIYAIASALGVDGQAEFETELVRINTPEVVERCRRRQHEKRAALAPIMSPETLAALEAGIESSKKEPAVDLGSFAKYADETILDNAIESACRYASDAPSPFEGAKKRPAPPR